MASWPGTLPQLPLIQSYKETTPNVTIRTTMDAGPAKVRRRFTAGVRTINVEFLLTSAQTQTLDDFYQTTLSGGSLSFTWVNPRTGGSESCRFVQPPEYISNSGYFRSSFSLEILP